MAPEQEARERAFYDHESEQPHRRRRAAADWGVNEDIFDRMPSRFSRVERRAEHHEIVIRSEGGTATATTEHVRDEGRRFERSAADERAAGPRRETSEWVRVDERDDARRGAAAARASVRVSTTRSGAAVRVEATRSDRTGANDDAGLDPRAAARAVMSWGEDLDDAPRGDRTSARGDGELDPRAAARAVMSWGEDLDDAPLVPGESRTIVLSRDDDEPSLDEAPRRDTGEFASLPSEPRERKTVVISGHPDRLPVPRTQRPPRTAVERIGHRPDRIAGYAVALGFLLVLIAVLTTGQ